MPHDPIDIVVRWPLIAVHAMRGGSYHRFRCDRLREDLQDVANGHLEKNITALARTVHDRLFVQNVIEQFR